MLYASRVAPTARANMRVGARLRALHDLFSVVDEDHSGSLSPAEFAAGTRALIGALEPAEERFLFNAFDIKRNGTVNLAEFEYALFRGLQAGGAAGDAAGVRAVVADALGHKVAAFRARAPGADGASCEEDVDAGARAADAALAAGQARQLRGQGVAAAASRVLCSRSGLGSAVCIAILVAGIVLGVIMAPQFYFLAFGGYMFYLVYSCKTDTAGLVSNIVSGVGALSSAFETVYRANASFRWHIECYVRLTRATPRPPAAPAPRP